MKLKLVLLAVLSFTFFVGAIFTGPISFDLSDLCAFGEQTRIVFLEMRLPKALTAMFIGGALGVSGLLMQTYFRNPLASPDLLGVQSGSSLFIALWSFFGPGDFFFLDYLGPVLSSFIGSTSVLLFLLFLAFKGLSIGTLLIAGLMISGVISGVVQILANFSSAEGLKNYLYWSMGSFERLSGQPLLVVTSSLFILCLLTLGLSRFLNSLYLGDLAAESLGLNQKKGRVAVLLLVSSMSSLVVAFCGPISFIGIIAPHLGRFFLKSNQHLYLLLATFFIGSILALGAQLFVSLDANKSLPINAILSLLGAPLVLALVLKWRPR